MLLFACCGCWCCGCVCELAVLQTAPASGRVVCVKAGAERKPPCVRAHENPVMIEVMIFTSQ